MKLTFLLFQVFALSFLQSDNFIFTKGNQKITLKIDNGSKNIYWEKTSQLSLKLENIDKENVNCSALGIRFSKANDKNNKNELILEIKPERDKFEKDTLDLHVGFKDTNSEYVSHKFTIIIK